MTDAASWWARKLGGQSAPAGPPSYPATQPYGQPGPYPAQQPQQPYGQQPPQPDGPPPQVTGDNFMQAAAHWKGGRATRTETGRCPHCGGDKYFSMSNGESLGGAGARIATERGMANTSPRCFECGYTLARPLQTGSQS